MAADTQIVLQTDREKPQAARYTYCAFGVFLITNLPLPGLAVSSSSQGLPAVLLRLGAAPADFDPARYAYQWYRSRLDAPSGQPYLQILYSGQADENARYWLRYADGINVFLDDNIATISVTWPETSCLEDAATYLLGTVMAIVAQLRGATCLHGCAVAIGGEMIAILGPQGTGKSTTAGAFAMAGYKVASDDLILLAERGGEFFVDPACPVLRLWPPSVQVLFGSGEALPRLTPGWDKRGLNLTPEGGFQQEPLPLAAIYFFTDRSDDPDAPFLTPISGAAALRRLVSNSWGHYVDKPHILAKQLRTFTRLSHRVPLKLLTPHANASRLPAMLQLLVDDVRVSRRDRVNALPAR